MEDTLIRVHRGLAAFHRECSLFTWRHHLTLNLARNRYRYFHRRLRHATVSLDCPVRENDSATILDSIACHAAGPRREVATREFTDLIAVCMPRLDEPHRMILTLTHTLGYGEIARRLGIKIPSADSPPKSCAARTRPVPSHETRRVRPHGARRRRKL